MRRFCLSWRLTATVFAAGLFVGWVILGWELWPAPPAQVHTSDLRPADRYAYLTLLAESFASTHDVAAAQTSWLGGHLASSRPTWLLLKSKPERIPCRPPSCRR